MVDSTTTESETTESVLALPDPPSMVDTPDVTIVTGASGWFGSALLEAFVGDGSWARRGETRALVVDDNDAARVQGLAQRTGTPVARSAGASTGTDTVNGGVVTVIGDVASGAGLDALFAEIDDGAVVDVIHAAGVIHPPSTAVFEQVNAMGTRRMVEIALARNVRRFVHVSSNSPFGTNAGPDDEFTENEPYRPYLAYGESKMNAELAVFAAVQQGLNAVIVRPPWFYGPHQPARQTTFFQMVRTGRFPIFGSGRQRRSMTYVDNLVQGVCRAELVPTEPGGAWWIADARSYEVVEIVETVGAALERAGYHVRAPFVRVPAIVGGLAEKADRVLQDRGRYQQQVHVLGEMNKTIACSIDAARSDLGYAPAVDLAEGMYRSVLWCQENGYLL